MKILILLSSIVLSLSAFANTGKGRVFVNSFGEAELSIHIKGKAAKLLYQELPVAEKTMHMTGSRTKQTSSVLCYQIDEKYTCSIYVNPITGEVTSPQ